jgi:hypothetical protein
MPVFQQWAIMHVDGDLCYGTARTRREAIRDFMEGVNSQEGREHLKWNGKELAFAIAVKYQIDVGGKRERR